jgi:DNA-binding response OmpR family regulator/HPt (histidine-containing phosphotransfer) domain-containing protein
MRVLIVDDDREVAHLLARDLGAHGYTVDTVGRAQHALAAAGGTDYALMVVDLGLPDGDGLDFVRQIRQRGSHTPILVVTARRRVEDRVVGLATGADDYLVKPFALPELRARVTALLRRPAHMRRAVIAVADIVVDRDALDASVAGTSLDLTRKQFLLLEMLARRKHQLTPKRMIEETLYGYDDAVSPNAIEAQIYKLRVSLRAAGAHATIETRRGIGYRLVETKATPAWGSDLAADFLARLADDRRELSALAARVGADDDSPLPRLAQLAHRLAGAAGTFGFRSIGVAAASLEDAAEAPGRLTGAERNTAVATSASQARRLTELIEAVLNGMKADTAI